ncbi:uncharacterized protein EDB93DRAFT_1106097 [Suillus bovinus]|uniref:uncharacterized protein n=1 Tax=Suillus bovinus TaxID=48563 RepID=UPI001B8712C2|nr:uncharacterized protein EDB93DRAFT_1106097 [Suillus bovinus]KAG2139613.1 hypothetical protein EDB93DRAFT_1106097 [Suillus bovinus]
MLVPPIDTLVGWITNKGKQPDCGSHRLREVDLDTETSRKKCKVVKMGASLPAVPTKSKDATKEVKQVEAKTKIGQVQPKAKGKGKEKAEKTAKPEQYIPGCQRCDDEPCLVIIGCEGLMEQDFNSRISSMHTKLLVMQLNVGTTVTLVNGLVGMVEKLRQEQVVPNPLFQPPTMSYGNSSFATAFGMRYLNSVYGPLVPPIPQSANIGQ